MEGMTSSAAGKSDFVPEDFFEKRRNK